MVSYLHLVCLRPIWVASHTSWWLITKAAETENKGRALGVINVVAINLHLVGIISSVKVVETYASTTTREGKKVA